MNGATSPIASAQPNIASVSGPGCGRSGTTSENVPRPVMSSRPRKISAPMPAESRPGTSTTPSIGPPSPAASSSRNAPSSGDPNSALTAAKLPAVAITMLACGGASRAARRTARTPSPLPIAISGASGPSTAPNDSVASAARNTPGSSIGGSGPPVWNPSAGEWPAGAGQVADRQRHEQPGERRAAAAATSRHGVEPERVRQVVEQQLLQLRDQLEEPVRDGGDRDADQRRQHEQLHIGA